MATDWKSIIENIKSQSIQFLTEKVMASIVKDLPAWLFWSTPLIRFSVGLFLSYSIKRLDWGAFFVLSRIDNTIDGKRYEAIVAKYKELPDDATDEERRKAEQDVKDAFDRLTDGRN